MKREEKAISFSCKWIFVYFVFKKQIRKKTHQQLSWQKKPKKTTTQCSFNPAWSSILSKHTGNTKWIWITETEMRGKK